MAIPNIHFLLVAFTVAGILVSGGKRASADGSCEDEIHDLAMKCGEYVRQPGPPVAPSKDCCTVMHRTNFTCVCPRVNKAVEKIISMDKVVYVAKYCNHPLVPGSKCGDYTVPKV